LQSSDHIQSALVYQGWIDAMDGCRNFDALAKINGASPAFGLA